MGMTVKYHLEVRDLQVGFREASRLVRRYQIDRIAYEKHWMTNATIQFAWMLSCFFASKQLAYFGSQWAVVFLGLGVVVGFLAVRTTLLSRFERVLRRQDAMASSHEFDSVLGDHTLTIDEAGIHHSHERQRNWFDWDLLEEVVLMPSYVLLGLRTGHAFFVPPSCLEQVGGTTAFINEIEKLRGDTREVRRQRWLATHDARCDHCGYSLRGLMGAQCPECGWVIRTPTPDAEKRQ